jgi:hypothetical protein
MKNIILAALCLIASISRAQITIDKNDMPDVGNYIVVSMTGDIGTADPSITGPNHSWNFAFLTPDSQKVDSFIAVTSTPFAYQYYFNNIIMYPNHKASYANPVFTPSFSTQFQVEDVYNFYKESTPEYSFVGFGAKINGVPASVKYDSIDVIYTFPMNYGNSDSCWSKYGFAVPNFGYYGQEKHRVNYVDGWGSLTTPYGTFPVLRVRSEIDATDTIYNTSFNFGFSTQRPREIEYKWIGTGSRIPLLQVNTRIVTSEVVTGIFYRDSLRNTSAGENVTAIPLVIYPNPASDHITISYQLEAGANVNIELYDATGRLAMVILNERQGSGAHSVKLDPSGLARGVYMVKIDKGAASWRKVILN